MIINNKRTIINNYTANIKIGKYTKNSLEKLFEFFK